MTGNDQPTAHPGVVQHELAGVTSPLPAGARVGQYVVVATLGHGRYGVTYRARDPHLHADVAVKEFLPLTLARRLGGGLVTPLSEHTLSLFQWGRAQFLDEAHKLSMLGARNTPAISVRDVFEDNNTAYMVMSLVRGESLEARLKRERRQSREVIDRLLPPLLDGLAAAHAAGLLHADIKPAHILIDAAGRPTLIDFSAACLALGERLGADMGAATPAYAAPERLALSPQGTWTDIYALASTLYHCVAGVAPLTARERLARDPLVPAAEIGRRGYEPGLLAAIDAGLRPVAAERPQTIVAWRAILEASSSQAGDAAQTSRPAASQPVAPLERAARGRVAVGDQRRRWTTAAAAAGALVATAIGIAPLLGPASETSPAVKRGTLADIPVPTLPPPASAQPAAETAHAGSNDHGPAAKHQAEAEASRLAAAEAARRQADEEARRLAAAEAKRQAEAEAARREALAAEAQRKAEAEARQAAESARQQAQAAEAKRQAEETARRTAELEREREALAAEARRRAEAEARQAAESARQQAQAAEAKRQAEEAARRIAELEREREALAAEVRRRAEAEARQAAESARQQAQAAEAKRQAEEAARRIAELERQREAAVAAQRAAAEKAAAEKAAAEKAAAERAAAERAAAERAAAEKAAAEKAAAEKAATERAAAQKAAAEKAAAEKAAAEKVAAEKAAAERATAEKAAAERAAAERAAAERAAADKAAAERAAAQNAAAERAAAEKVAAEKAAAEKAAAEKAATEKAAAERAAVEKAAAEKVVAERVAAEKAAAESAAAEKAAAEKAAEERAAAEAVRRAEEQARAQAEARRRAEAEAAAREANDKARLKAETARYTDAETRAVEADLAARQRAEADARIRGERQARRQAAETAARQEADAWPTGEAGRRLSEAAEAALQLPEAERKRLQVALTALGHEVSPITGTFGPRTRAMIRAWQKQQGWPETSYITATQLAALHLQVAAAQTTAAVGTIDPRQAAANEATLGLTEADRIRAQTALTTLGYPIGAATGYFGPHTRARLVEWQKQQGLPPTGFLTADQWTSLQQQASAAAANRDGTQRPASGQPGPKADPRQAEADETALGLTEADRKRAQTALTTLGYPIAPATGYFGPYTRARLVEWQKQQGLLPTGFLTADQWASLQQQASAAAANRDAAQRPVGGQPRPTADPRQAEADETALGLTEADRKRAQTALTTLGYPIAAATGYFGPYTRARLVEWQKQQGLPPTGFLTADQWTSLQQQASAAAANRDGAQRPAGGQPGPTADPRQAEADETALGLTEADRKRVQVALSSLGHEVGATTGFIGPRTRAMIVAWQKKSGLPETGFLSAPQWQALQHQAAPALAKHDAEQRRQDGQRPRTEADRWQAETDEAALGLSDPDRKRVQFALTSLGYEVSPLSGFFGPRTRAMLAAWQKAQGLPETGYLNSAQWATLRQQAAGALAQYDPLRH